MCAVLASKVDSEYTCSTSDVSVAIAVKLHGTTSGVISQGLSLFMIGSRHAHAQQMTKEVTATGDKHHW